MLHTRRIAPVLLSLLLGGCAAPAALRGEFPPLTPEQAATSAAGPSSAAQPTRVRWGGTILSMKNSEKESCFEILSRPLDSTARPQRTDHDQGRFLTCYKGFKDPEVYKQGRDVTVIGTLTGFESRKVDDFEYTYPQVAAESIYLWQERREPTQTYVVDPFFYPYPYYGYGYYYRPAPRPAPVVPQSEAPAAPTAPLPMIETPQPRGRLLGR